MPSDWLDKVVIDRNGYKRAVILIVPNFELSVPLRPADLKHISDFRYNNFWKNFIDLVQFLLVDPGQSSPIKGGNRVARAG
jgi:hypothetical protein